ncbi:hypothetical protein WK36_22430 [Burkholderia cepacia]|nr:hypothetical protein WK36_22430 [Burkholderia cepacia]
MCFGLWMDSIVVRLWSPFLNFLMRSATSVHIPKKDLFILLRMLILRQRNILFGRSAFLWLAVSVQSQLKCILD